jgi:hypothetical protein
MRAAPELQASRRKACSHLDDPYLAKSARADPKEPKFKIEAAAHDSTRYSRADLVLIKHTPSRRDCQKGEDSPALHRSYLKASFTFLLDGEQSRLKHESSVHGLGL